MRASTRAASGTWRCDAGWSPTSAASSVCRPTNLPTKRSSGLRASLRNRGRSPIPRRPATATSWRDSCFSSTCAAPINAGPAWTSGTLPPIRWSSPRPSEGTDRASDEALLDGLDRCLQQLNEYDRALILEYYAGNQQERIERRRALAARLNLTLNALSIRACRIRDRLEKCLDAQSPGT